MKILRKPPTIKDIDIAEFQANRVRIHIAAVKICHTDVTIIES